MERTGGPKTDKGVLPGLDSDCGTGSVQRARRQPGNCGPLGNALRRDTGGPSLQEPDRARLAGGVWMLACGQCVATGDARAPGVRRGRRRLQGATGVRSGSQQCLGPGWQAGHRL